MRWTAAFSDRMAELIPLVSAAEANRVLTDIMVRINSDKCFGIQNWMVGEAAELLRGA